MLHLPCGHDFWLRVNFDWETSGVHALEVAPVPAGNDSWVALDIVASRLCDPLVVNTGLLDALVRVACSLGFTPLVVQHVEVVGQIDHTPILACLPVGLLQESTCYWFMGVNHRTKHCCNDCLLHDLDICIKIYYRISEDTGVVL